MLETKLKPPPSNQKSNVLTTRPPHLYITDKKAY